ncbi:hypothetical protein Riv7116_3396 [Rivularia sp. PCC 7116]|uniref:hypothetical protein n=1 Tax=Rivularia sp. PCC 7116 TaxID=373994 RepID=UPI00029EF110|nr:hypothetical protein [Rivularia sp. PCC 7116]AFY55853.1 hypothetical protein Riv7116_3396 [Rivularia sp. PCC 7116]
MKIGLWLLATWLLYSCLGAFLNLVNMPWWVFVFYGFLAVGWASESAKFVVGIGFFGVWFKVISWLIAIAACLGLLVGVFFGAMAGSWVTGALVGLGIGTLAGLGVIVSAWLTYNVFFVTAKRKKAKSSNAKKSSQGVSGNIDNLNAKIIVETIWSTFKGVGLAGIAVLGCYMGGKYGFGGAYGLATATVWALLLGGILFLAASELKRRLSNYKAFVLLSTVLEIALISGYIISFSFPLGKAI